MTISLVCSQVFSVSDFVNKVTFASGFLVFCVLLLSIQIPSSNLSFLKPILLRCVLAYFSSGFKQALGHSLLICVFGPISRLYCKIWVFQKCCPKTISFNFPGLSLILKTPVFSFAKALQQ